ncbi:phosphonate metabolism protein/1,5-bisphosphokinase (PRPP-forming) PhnN [Rhizobium helianthi]|uniref:Ribose 1,5-bisphosphate phosphokinase PhnN n=1 Tax=Rhizobium helianthi TaxID=1132695 RepID=A0ABW4LZJ9_9HYPH
MSIGKPSTGILIVVVGPSGVGKDTVIAHAARHFAADARVRFVRRWITRPQDAGGEDHRPVDPDAFLAHEASGGFAVSWRAHGLCYGIPYESREELNTAPCLIVNGSRSALPLFLIAFPRVAVVEITARPEILAARLAMRGRESHAQIAARLSHRPTETAISCQTWTIDNSEAPEKAGLAFISIIRDYVAAS